MNLKPVRPRYKQANYLKVGETFEFMGLGFRDLNEEPGAQVSTKRYINEVSSSKSISGYEWQAPYNIDQIRSEKVIEHILSIGELQKTGADAESEYVIVDMDKPGTEDKKFKARKINVAIEVSKMDTDDGLMNCEGNFLGVGDIVEGEFDIQAKAFTPKA